MSDSATPTPAAPAPAAAPQTPAAQPASPPAGQALPQPTPGTPAAPAAPEAAKEPTNVREAKQALRRGPDRFPSTITEAKAALGKGEHHAQNQPREPDGKFAATEPSGEPTPDLNASGEPTPPATPPADAAATTQLGEPEAPKAEGAPDVPEGMVRIDIPKGHPAWEAGREFALVPKEHEKYHRWAINNAVRRDDVEAAVKNGREWQQYANRLKAELDATREFAGGIFADPTVIAQIDDIRRTYGDEAAKRFEAGLWQEQQAKVAEITKGQETEAQKVATAQTTMRFVRDVLRTAATRYPEWVQGWPAVDQMSDAQIAVMVSASPLANAFAAYGARMEASGSNDPNINEFLQLTDPVFVQDPRARQRLEARQKARLEQERTAAAKAEADRLAAEERKKLEEAAARRSQYPWMGVPATAVPAQVGVDEGAGGPRTVHEARRSLSRRGRATAGA